MPFSASEVLEQLDRCATAYTFPILDNAYVYPADTRMTLFGDSERWAIVIEVLGFNSHMGGTGGIDDALYCFGNCLGRPPGISPERTLRPVEDGDSGSLFEPPDGMTLRREATDLRIRGRRVEVPRDLEHYLQRGVFLKSPPDVQGFELLRGLLPKHRELLLATDEESQALLAPDLPRLLRLDEWNHPDVSEGDLPSESPTFQALAETLKSGDVTRFKPRSKPNTHWSCWPEGGIL